MLCLALFTHVPRAASFGTTVAASYQGPTCPYMDGIHTCSKSATRHRAVASLEACKTTCDALPGCKFVMWSRKFSGYCYTAADCVTSPPLSPDSKRNCNLQLYTTKSVGSAPVRDTVVPWYCACKQCSHCRVPQDPMHRNLDIWTPCRGTLSWRPQVHWILLNVNGLRA